MKIETCLIGVMLCMLDTRGEISLFVCLFEECSSVRGVHFSTEFIEFALHSCSGLDFNWLEIHALSIFRAVVFRYIGANGCTVFLIAY